MSYEKLPEWRLWLRALTPSPASLIVSFALTVLVVGLHLLLLSDDPELFATQLAGARTDDRLVQIYETAIQQPLDSIFGSGPLGVLLTMLVWGVVGWIVYAGADFVMKNIKDFRYSAEEIHRPLKNQVVQHPLRRQMLVRMLWRFFIGLLFIIGSIALQPLVSGLFQQDIRLFTADSSLDIAEAAVTVLLGWLAVFHVYVVLFRLFVLRTRFFGKVIY